MANVLKHGKHVKSAWKARSSKGLKPWGEELQWAGHDSIHGKILYIKAGHRTSFKYHPLKSESLFFLRGRAQVTYGTENSLEDPIGFPLQIEGFEAGDALLVQSGCPYRIEAIEDCEVIEIGNHLRDAPVRIEDDYDRINEGAK